MAVSVCGGTGRVKEQGLNPKVEYNNGATQWGLWVGRCWEVITL